MPKECPSTKSASTAVRNLLVIDKVGLVDVVALAPPVEEEEDAAAAAQAEVEEADDGCSGSGSADVKLLVPLAGMGGRIKAHSCFRRPPAAVARSP